MSPSLATRLLPFLRWWPYSGAALRADFVAGLTVALVLVPQSMAYALLAGLPAYYGLYAAFLPVMVAALWGSSNQLASGPVALVALLTASSLAPLAAAGSEAFVALAVLLALLVGGIQLALGLLRLGVVVNFLSHPVIVGFTNAAALIIAASQVSKILGVPMDRSDSFLRDLWMVLRQAGDAHWPTVAMGVGAFALIVALRRLAPRLPGVLIAVVIATAVSAWIGFEQKGSAPFDAVADADTRRLLAEYAGTRAQVAALERERDALNAKRAELARNADAVPAELIALDYRRQLVQRQIADAQQENRVRMRALRRLQFERGADGRLHAAGHLPPGEAGDGRRWRIVRIGEADLALSAGGEVVGTIPKGLPPIGLPRIDWDALPALLSAAAVIALIGFMEAISVAKAVAVRTRQRLDPNQELIGQGLANVVAAFSQAFPVSGSFSRTAVNADAGAVTGMSSVFTGLFVLATLLLLTPLLYHLPQAVLAAIIIAAVVGLLNFAAIKHAWQANRHDGIAAVVTFVATLALAPHLDIGVLVGAGLAIVLFLLRTMKPRVAILGRHPDGALRDARVHGLPTSPHVTVLRFDGRLYFANVAYFEDAVLEAVAANPRAGHVLIVGDGINEIDASGEEVVRHLVERLRASGMRTVFAGLKKQVVDVLRATGALATIGEENIYPTADAALAAIRRELEGRGIDTRGCPLLAAPARAESAQPV